MGCPPYCGETDADIWDANFTGSLPAGMGTKDWTQADWDYDGDVDPNDIAKWSVNYRGSEDGFGGGEMMAGGREGWWGEEQESNGIEIWLPADAQAEAVDILRRMGYVVYVGP